MPRSMLPLPLLLLAPQKKSTFGSAHHLQTLSQPRSCLVVKPRPEKDRRDRRGCARKMCLQPLFGHINTNLPTIDEQKKMVQMEEHQKTKCPRCGASTFRKYGYTIRRGGPARSGFSVSGVLPAAQSGARRRVSDER